MDNLFSNIQKSLNQNNNNNNKKTLLQRQQISEQKINELLEKSSQSLLCGPTCQKIKVTDDLRQKYLDAETNALTAPIKLEQSKRNYYVFSEGRTYYENMKEEELKEKAKKISELIAENFNNELSSANTMNIYLNTALTNSENTKELLKQYLEKNQLLKLKLRESRGDILTNDRKTYYETEAIDRLNQWYKFLWYIYYIGVFILIIALLLSPSKYDVISKQGAGGESISGKNLYFKLVISVLFIFYPYYIGWIVNKINSIWLSLKSNIPKNVYNNL